MYSHLVSLSNIVVTGCKSKVVRFLRVQISDGFRRTRTLCFVIPLSQHSLHLICKICTKHPRPTGSSRIQMDAERRRREAGVEQSKKIRSRSCRTYVHRFVGGWVSGYVWYLELSREPKHAAQQMRYKNVYLSNGHCLGTIIIF